MRFFAFFFWAALVLSAEDFDLLIRNARVVDGTGNPWYRADIGVRDGKIAAVGDLSHDAAERTVQFSQGFDLVLVNGQPVVEDGKLTRARPGKIVRHISQ